MRKTAFHLCLLAAVALHAPACGSDGDGSASADGGASGGADDSMNGGSTGAQDGSNTGTDMGGTTGTNAGGTTGSTTGGSTGATTGGGASGTQGVSWTVDGKPYSSPGAAELKVTGIQAGSGKATQTTIKGGSLVDSSNVTLTLTVPSPKADPVTLPAGTYNCMAGSPGQGQTFVQIRETSFTGNSGETCFIKIDEETGEGGRLKGSFKATLGSPAFPDKKPVVEGTFDVADNT